MIIRYNFYYRFLIILPISELALYSIYSILEPLLDSILESLLDSILEPLLDYTVS